MTIGNGDMRKGRMYIHYSYKINVSFHLSKLCTLQSCMVIGELKSLDRRDLQREAAEV